MVGKPTGGNKKIINCGGCESSRLKKSRYALLGIYIQTVYLFLSKHSEFMSKEKRRGRSNVCIRLMVYHGVPEVTLQ